MKAHSVKVNLQLLEIRLSAARRNIYIIGSIFMIAFLLFFLAGMLGYLVDREIFLVSALLVALGFSLVNSLIKYEVAKALTDFAGRLLSDNSAV